MNTNISFKPADWWKFAYDTFNFPLSGPVNIMQQFGFYNINYTEKGDQGYIIEKRVVEDVASYGRQLGWITEVLSIVIDEVEKHNNFIKDLPDEQKKSMKKFYDLIERVKEIKRVEQKKLG